ncbi:hypothetical protein FRB91_010772 [Serendipita sp. 411]|nr:hypothetical protein FRB91_010772 [Serendipita sp. 411]
MLMRLRQICVHPCLLKAYETAYEIADTRDENDKKVIEEAARLVSNEFVALVKKNLREIALERIQNEKLKGDNATVEDNCSICFEPFNGDTVVTAPCAHSFCRVCIEAHITRPRDEADNKYHDHERDCPLCRQTISLNLLFNRRPFEPTDAELDINRSNDHVDSFSWEVDESGQGRYKARMQKKKAKKPVVDNYSDLDDFIVDDDEEEDCATYKPRPKQTQQLNNGKAPRVVISDDEDEEKPAGKSIRKENDDVYEVSSSESDDELDKLARRKSLAIQRAKTKLIKKNKPTIVLDSDEDEDANTSEPLTGPKSKKPFDPMDRPEMMSSFLPSTKMQYMMGYLEDVERENPDDKTMIVSQWTSALDLCSDYLSERGIRYIRYQGNMNSRERSDAINTFMTKGSVKVMLMSVRCGGVGLNITRACRVISLDPSWNAATDQQCFDRVHRLGQTKEVFIERLMINNTVETRVRDIQIRKQGLSDAALGEGNYQRVRFTVGELASLFGLR